MNWIELKEADAVDNFNEETIKSPDKSFVIFKHSTRCSTSRMALRMFESGWEKSIPAYIINVVEHRSASNKVASQYRILHESPQVLVIKNGRCIYDTSHSSIDPIEVLQKCD